MRSSRLHTTTLSISLACCPLVAQATTILIDFGRSDNQTTEGNFNNVYGTGTGLDTPTVELIDSAGADTGITLNVDFAAGGSWAGAQADYLGPYPTSVADQPETAIQDSMFIRAPATSTFTLSGLDPETSYDILIYGARSNNGGANTEWTFTDGSGETLVAFDVFGNATEVASFEGLVPDENNELTLLYTTTGDGSRPRGAMSLMQITIGGAGDARFQITDIEFDRDPEAPANTVAWSSLPDRSYGLYFSTDMVIWEEIDDSIPSRGEFTSFAHPLLPNFSQLVGAPTLYYRVELTD